MVVLFAQARMGVHECVSHKLIDPFQVLFDKVANGTNNNLAIFTINPFRFELASLRSSAIGRSIRRSVQVHSIADAQWTSQNHRWQHFGICERLNLDMCSLGLPFDESLYKSEHSIEDAEIQVYTGLYRKCCLT